MNRFVNQLGTTFVTFVILTGFLLWRQGLVHLGSIESSSSALSQDDTCGGEGHQHGTSAATHGHGEAQAQSADACCPADSLEHLESINCEHSVLIYECDECRYEANVVKVEDDIFFDLFEAAEVTAQSIESSLSLTGTIQLDETRVMQVQPIAGGRVVEVRKALGDRVTKGEILAVIDSQEVGIAKSELLQARTDLELARRNVERLSSLREKQIVSEAAYLSARTDLQKCEAVVSTGEKNLMLLGVPKETLRGLDSSEASNRFGRLSIQSPCNGTIVARNTTEGALVNSETVLYRIADLSHLWVWCQLFERDLGTLQNLLDQSSSVNVLLQTPAFADNNFPGVVDLIASELDTQTRTIPVRVRVDNPEGKLRPGMFATVTIAFSSGERALCIPKDAVVSDEGVDFVFKHWKDDYWVRQDLSLGRPVGDSVEVIAGLSDSDWVVVSGAFLLKSDLLREKMGAGCAD